MNDQINYGQPSISVVQDLQNQIHALQGMLYASEYRHRDKAFQIAKSAHLKQLCKYDTTSFATSAPKGYPIITITNQAGSTVSYQLSRCYGFELKYYINIDGGDSALGCSFKRESGTQGYFELKENKLTSRNVFLGFTMAGGSFCIAGSDAKKGELLLSFLISIWSDDLIEIRTKKLWIPAGEKKWLLNSLGKENSFIFKRKINLCEIERELLFGYAVLKMRLKPLGAQLENAVVWLGEPSSYELINLNQRERLLEEAIESSCRVMKEVWVGDIEDGTNYAKARAKNNILKLRELIKKDDAFLILVSKELSEYTVGCLPISAKNQFFKDIQIDFSWHAVCEAIEMNQEGFELVVSSVIEESMNRYQEKEFTKDLTALACVVKTLSWFLCLKGKDELGRYVDRVCTQTLDTLATQWDSLDDEDDVERFANALYVSVCKGSISLYDRFAIPDSTKSSQIETFYDEGRIYISSSALSEVLESMPGVSESMILRILEVAGLIQKQSNGIGRSTYYVKSTVFFTNGDSERIRVLPLPRKMFFRPGRVDITKIKRKEG